jgi:CheY-like chemotaxis protein/cold shock CspA family protein
MPQHAGIVRTDNAKGYWSPGRDDGNDVYVHYSAMRHDDSKDREKGDSRRISVEAVTLNKFEQSSAEVGVSATNNGSAARVRVLVADDEQVIANTLALILTMSGFDARAVYNSRAALDSLRSFEPNILISDVMMPGMTGIEAAIAILARYPSCKVLLLSAQATTVDLLIAARAQGHNFEILAKPIHPSDLLRRLRSGAFDVQSAL